MVGLEIELKAGLPPSDSARVARRLKRLTGEDGHPTALVATYYDTANHKLRAEGIALRIRREAGQLVQTVKAGRSQLGGFHSVREVNGPVARAVPDLSAISDPGLRERLIDLIAGDRLAGRYQTRVTRRTWQVKQDLGLVEVALDRGVIRAGGRQEPVCEVEFELLGGSPEALFAIARALIGDLPANLSLPNKAARGEALADGAAWQPSVAGGRPVAPESGASGEDSWRAALAASAGAVAANLLITHVSEEPEGPHQLRVALRRLRAAERLHRPLLSKAVSREISGTARDMGRLLAPLRDSDVLTADMVAIADAGLCQSLVQANAAMRRKVRERLNEAGATGFSIRLIELAAIGGWRPEDCREDWPVEVLAAKVLSRLWRRAAQLGDRLSTLTDEERHIFRKTLKKIRYCIDITPIEMRPKSFVSALKKLQEDLGTLNDIAILGAWTPGLEEEDAAAFEAVRARLLQVARGKSDLALGRACRHWRGLRAEARPWEKPSGPSRHPARNR